MLQDLSSRSGSGVSYAGWKHDRKSSWVESPGMAWHGMAWRPGASFSGLLACFIFLLLLLLFFRPSFPHAVVGRAGRDDGAGLLSQKGARTIEIQCERRGTFAGEQGRGSGSAHTAECRPKSCSVHDDGNCIYCYDWMKSFVKYKTLENFGAVICSARSQRGALCFSRHGPSQRSRRGASKDGHTPPQLTGWEMDEWMTPEAQKREGKAHCV